MKGLIFVELIEFIEDQFGFDVADTIIEGAELSTGGAYTSVGTYPSGEAVAIVLGLHEQTQVPVPALLKAFGRHLFGRLASSHPHFIAGLESPFEVLRKIEQHIHVEVRRLYPDAELPSFAYEPVIDETRELVMVYRSARPLADLCEGLIEGCCAHFEREITIEREAIESEDGAVRFRLKAA